MVSTIAEYGDQYKGLVRLERVLFIAQARPDCKKECVDYLLGQIALYPAALGFYQKLSDIDVFLPKDEADALAKVAADVLGNAKGTYENMMAAYRTHEFSQATRCALKLREELLGATGLTTRQRLDALMDASLVSIVANESLRVDPVQLADCEALVEPDLHKKRPTAAAQAAARSGLASSGSVAADAFYPTAADVLKCRVMRALCHLKNKDFRECAVALLTMPQACLDVPAERISDLATRADVALYATATAFATMDGDDLRRHVLDNPNYREWVAGDDCSVCHRILTAFDNSEWAALWAAFGEARAAAMRDMFLAPSAHTLFGTIAAKLLLLYLQPYATVRLASMARDFGLAADDLERQLVALIAANKLSARIDEEDDLLVRYTPDPRADCFESAAQAGAALEKSFERDTFYMSVVRSGYLNTNNATREVPAAAAAAAPTAGRSCPSGTAQKFQRLMGSIAH